jgi:protein-tyrosine kinase
MGKMQQALRKADDGTPAEAATSSRGTALLGTGLQRLEAHPRLVLVGKPDSAPAQQVRGLRDNVLTLAGQSGFRVISMTSSRADESRAVAVANLACALAEDAEAQIIVVDTNMRDPAQHELFSVDNDRGLSDYLKGGTMLELVVQRSRLRNLWVLPAGAKPADPTELLSGKRMDDLLGRLRRDYTMVLIDAPPVLQVPEAPSILQRSDGVLLAVGMAKTPRDAASDALRAIKSAEANLLGTVLTGLE